MSERPQSIVRSDLQQLALMFNIEAARQCRCLDVIDVLQ